MNRNGKHPGKTYRRRASAGDTTKNSRGYRVTGSWDSRPNRPAVRSTQDKHQRDRLARDMAAQGAYVIVEEHLTYGQWRTLYELNGPAMLAEQAAEQQLAAAGHPPTPDSYRHGEDDRHRSWLAWMNARAEVARREQAAAGQRRRRLAVEVTTNARELMSPPAIVRPENRQRARHITGAQR